MLKIEQKPISEIIPYENNPRKNEQAVDAVAESIRQFGFKVPIIIDKENIIIAGHTRLKAAEKLGLDSVPVIVADDLTEEQATAFRLVDNKTGELAEWDFEKLKEEIETIKSIDMAEFGFMVEQLQSEKEGTIEELHEMKSDGVKTIICPRCGRVVTIE